MAHNHTINHERTSATQGRPSPNSANDDDEPATDVDEPPDVPIRFSKLARPPSETSSFDTNHLSSQQSRKASLLTQALLTSPELTPLSDAEAPVLTSDGGMTSPTRTTTPSPPLPSSNYNDLASLESSDTKIPSSGQNSESAQMPSALGIDRKQETKVEEGLGRRRCITFACGRKAPLQIKDDQSAKPEETVKEAVVNLVAQPKRPCLLKFACPVTRPRTDLSRYDAADMHNERSKDVQLQIKQPSITQNTFEQQVERQEPKDVNAPTTESLARRFPAPLETDLSNETKAFNRIDFQKSESTRFHEFAGAFNGDDEWTNEQTAYRQKMTIADTLRKENAIRRLAEEAEEEADDEDDDVADVDESEDDLDEDDENNNLDVEHRLSDGGNESDDEEGFAASDDESEVGSNYQFWTPGLTTAATSTDHIEHIRPTAKMAESDSSIESTIERREPRHSEVKARREHRSHRRKSSSMHPGTSNLPDSSDFVIGTLDEDRPLEEAYLSHLEERKRSRHKLLPQDIDPSFPRSDSEGENDEADDGDENEDDPNIEAAEEEEDEEGASDSETEPDAHQERMSVRRDSSNDEKIGRYNKGNAGETNKAAMPSPKRLHSPPPRRLFGQAVHRLRSPPPLHRRLTSPPSSRRPSPNGSLSREGGIEVPHLAQRPNLTHTTSLPRTPNPFWSQHRRNRFHGASTPSAGTSPRSAVPIQTETHSRGPVDIVQGLENKRQRRKEKFWRIHCRNAQLGKEKERKVQPGKGAERMREVGLEMADRFKGYGQKVNLMLSV